MSHSGRYNKDHLNINIKINRSLYICPEWYWAIDININSRRRCE